MLATDLRHMEHQIAMTPSMRTAIDFLKRADLGGLAAGKVEIDGQRVFATVQRYETAAAGTPKFEHHAAYIDVQVIVSGEEMIGWAPAELMTVTEAYSAERDICFGTIPAGKWTPVHLQAGQLAVFYPEDAHAPKLAAGASSSVLKIVVKVAV